MSNVRNLHNSKFMSIYVYYTDGMPYIDMTLYVYNLTYTPALGDRRSVLFQDYSTRFCKDVSISYNLIQKLVTFNKCSKTCLKQSRGYSKNAEKLVFKTDYR